MGGGKGCSVVGCSSRTVSDKHKHFYKFPKDDSYRDIWLTFTRRGSDYTVRDSSCICEQHFDPSCFIYKKKQQCLAKSSVPTIFYRDTPDGSERIVLTFDRDVLHYVEEETLLNPAFDKEKREKELVERRVNKLKAIAKLCRFCFEDQENKTVPIAKLKDYGINPIEILELLGINTDHNDVFSKNTCEECFQQVMTIDGFRKRCQKTQNGLIAAIKDIDGQVQKIRRSVCEPDSWFKPETIWDQDDDDNENLMSPPDHSKTDVKYVKTEPDPNFQEIIIKEEKSEDSDDDCFNELDLSPFKMDPDDDTSETVEPLTVSKKKKTKTVLITEKSPKKATSSSAIKSQRKRPHNLRDYECYYCHERCAGQVAFRIHKCKAKLTCEVQGCGKIFTKLSGFNVHISCVHKLPKVTRLYCPTCQLSSVLTHEEFKEHTRVCEKTAEKQISVTSVTCETCGKVCPTMKSYSVHAMFHKISEPYVAPTTKWHVKRGVFICEACGKEFATNRYLIDHVKRLHTEPDKNPTFYFCAHCDKSRTSKTALKKHIQNVHTISLAPCSFCEKVFRNKTLLNKHMIYHKESKRIHVCPLCPDRLPFFTANDLRRHQEAHHGYGNGYQCAVCMSTYKTRSGLSQHKAAAHSDATLQLVIRPTPHTRCNI